MLKRQRGNVLFLILIAVALFAALSYAVTKSTSGGGNADSETQQIDIAVYNQNIALLRTTIQRMMIINGLSIDQIHLCDSSGLCLLGPVGPCSSGDGCVFASEGGGLSVSNFISNKFGIVVSEASEGVTIAGHGSSNIIITSLAIPNMGIPYSEDHCKALLRSYGLSETVEEELDSNSIHANGIASLEGQWDICYDSNPTGTDFHQAVHLLATN